MKKCCLRSMDSIPHLDWITERGRERERERERERAMWSCTASAAGPNDTTGSAHTQTRSQQTHELLEQPGIEGVRKGDVAAVCQRFVQMDHESLRHENWPRIKNYTYISESYAHNWLTLGWLEDQRGLVERQCDHGCQLMPRLIVATFIDSFDIIEFVSASPCITGQHQL